jgi:hypothetical protein
MTTRHIGDIIGRVLATFMIATIYVIAVHFAFKYW